MNRNTSESSTRVWDCTTAAIVHYGPTEPTLKQVAAVREWAEEVIVVANDGTNDSWFLDDPAVHWIVPDRNLGFGGGVNLAFNHCRGSILVALNNDIHIPPTAARAARKVMDDGADVVGFRTVDGNGRFFSGAGSLSNCLLRSQMSEPLSRVEECEWVTGACMFIRRDCLERVRFDERYFLCSEDLDFCVRAREKGYVVAVLNEPGVVHIGGTTIGNGALGYYYTTRNPIWFLRTRRGALLALSLALRDVILVMRVALADLVKGRGWERSRYMALGIWHGVSLRLAPGSLPYSWEPIAQRLDPGLRSRG